MSNTKKAIWDHCRLMVVLRVVATVTRELDDTPRQRHLLTDEMNRFSEEWDALGLRREFPFGPDHLPQITNLAYELRDLGLMEMDEDRKRQRYVLTPAGSALADLLGADWTQWPGPEEVRAYAAKFAK